MFSGITISSFGVRGAKACKPRFVVATLLTAGCIAACTPKDSDSAGDHAPAPDLTLVSLQGDTVTLQSLRGEAVLLNIWATWCAPCREEMPLLEQLHKEHRDAGLRIVGVSIDARGEEERIGRFLTEFNVTFPIWLDPDERASYVFRAIGVPATYMVDRSGLIIWRHLGPITADDPALKTAVARALRPLSNAG